MTLLCDTRFTADWQMAARFTAETVLVLDLNGDCRQRG
jgi:hypothetical protein